MAENSDFRWGVARRFEFIEWRAYWVGRVNRKDLEDEFQISTPQASVDLRNYQEVAPKNIEYDATEKAYVATPSFNPKFLKLSPDRYLLQLQAIATGAVSESEMWFDHLPPFDITPPIARGAEAYIVRAVVKAIETRAPLGINYQSLTKTAIRTIYPHALAHDGYRWHARAWSVEREEFRDYVLGRILSPAQPTPSDAPDATYDIEWQTKFTLRVTAHPDLDDRQKAAIEHDYRLENGDLAVPMRFALAYYFVKRYNLDLRDGQINPARAQLFLKNLDEYNTALQAAKAETKARIAARRSNGTAIQS